MPDHIDRAPYHDMQIPGWLIPVVLAVGALATVGVVGLAKLIAYAMGSG